MPSNLWYEPGEYLQMKCYLITPPTLQPAETSGEKCYVRPLKSLLKTVQRICKFQFQVMKSAWNWKIQGRFRRKTTTARKEGIVVSEPVCKAFFAVNWYHTIIFTHLYFWHFLPCGSPTVKLVICEWTAFMESDQSHRFTFGPMSFI